MLQLIEKIESLTWLSDQQMRNQEEMNAQINLLKFELTTADESNFEEKTKELHQKDMEIKSLKEQLKCYERILKEQNEDINIRLMKCEQQNNKYKKALEHTKLLEEKLKIKDEQLEQKDKKIESLIGQLESCEQNMKEQEKEILTHLVQNDQESYKNRKNMQKLDMEKSEITKALEDKLKAMIEHLKLKEAEIQSLKEQTKSVQQKKPQLKLLQGLKLRPPSNNSSKLALYMESDDNNSDYEEKKNRNDEIQQLICSSQSDQQHLALKEIKHLRISNSLVLQENEKLQKLFQETLTTNGKLQAEHDYLITRFKENDEERKELLKEVYALSEVKVNNQSLHESRTKLATKVEELEKKLLLREQELEKTNASIKKTSCDISTNAKASALAAKRAKQADKLNSSNPFQKDIREFTDTTTDGNNFWHKEMKFIIKGLEKQLMEKNEIIDGLTSLTRAARWAKMC